MLMSWRPRTHGGRRPKNAHRPVVIYTTSRRRRPGLNPVSNPGLDRVIWCKPICRVIIGWCTATGPVNSACCSLPAYPAYQISRNSNWIYNGMVFAVRKATPQRKFHRYRLCCNTGRYYAAKICNIPGRIDIFSFVGNVGIKISTFRCTERNKGANKRDELASVSNYPVTTPEICAAVICQEPSESYCKKQNST